MREGLLATPRRLKAAGNHRCEITGVKFLTGLLSHGKIWWPGTELNRRRQPFQNRGFEYFQRLTSRRGLPWHLVSPAKRKHHRCRPQV